MKELLAKIPFSLLLIAFIGYLGYDFYWFSTDPASPLLQKQEEIRAAKQQNVALMERVRKAEEFIKNLDHQRATLRELSGRLDEMKGTVSEDLDVANFVKLVITEAKKVGLTVKGLKPNDTKIEELYAEHRFELTYHAVYVQLLVFLERLSNIQKIVRVDNFEIRPVSAPASRYMELEGTVELKVYRYLRSKADDVGRRDSDKAALTAPRPGNSVKAGGP